MKTDQRHNHRKGREETENTTGITEKERNYYAAQIEKELADDKTEK